MSASIASPPFYDPASATLTLSAFLELFEDIVEESTGFVVICPAHDDSRPSLRVGFNPDTKKLALKCRAGCKTTAVVEALGLSMSQLFNVELGDIAEVRSVGQVPQ